VSLVAKVVPVPVVPNIYCSPLCKWQLPDLRTSGESSEGKPYHYTPQKLITDALVRNVGKPEVLHAYWWGLLYHTTGPGPESLAEKRGWTVTEAAVWTYAQLWMNCAHYLNPPDGVLIQIVSEAFIAPHCGVKPWQYTRYKDGSWVEHTPAVMLAEWRKAWPNVKDPTRLYPHVGSANPDVLGVENIPQPDGTFTDAQYATLKAFTAERDAFHGMKIETHRNRLLGHEDVNTYWYEQNGRATKGGGIDPGARRPAPKFFWDRVRS